MLLAVVVFGLCSCEDDKDPVLQKPTEFVLNQPATSELYYALNLSLIHIWTLPTICSV